MLAIILVVLMGLVFAYFATLNTQIVDINFRWYELQGVPLYSVILISISLGLLMAGVIYLVKHLSTSLTISEKEDDIKKANKQISELTKRVHKLELENTKLKSQLGEEDDFDEDSI